MVSILLPVITTMNTYNQMYQNEAKQREKTKHEQETVCHKYNYNGTSCAQVINENGTAYCFYPPLPPETPATMITVCGI